MRLESAICPQVHYAATIRRFFPENVCFFVDPHHLMVLVQCPPLLRYCSVTSFFVGHHLHLCTMGADGDQYPRLRLGHRHHWHDLLPKVRLVRSP